MESILARALEYTLKYWLKSFTRDQFKLQGRTVQLSNLDINGDAIHASVGLPPALQVSSARVGKLEIKLPSVSNVQYEPIVVEIDRLDLVLEENTDSDACKSSTQSTTSSGKGSGYGFADKIADGMTLVVGTVNLMVGTCGGVQCEGGAAWASPLASITIRNLLLYTTNENWQVVNLKEARDFSNNKKCIYVFKKLEWGSLSVDLLPHPDMFTDANLTYSNNGENGRDDDGAKRVFFGGERFLEGISGEANITVQRTKLNSPLGLEVQLHLPEAVCPALSEPGLRALLRFMTGFYVCLNRGDVDPKAQQRCAEAAGRSIVSIVVDHIFLCIKDSEFQLELLMQSLFYSRASVSDGENTKNLSRITVSGLFLRDTFSHPSCTLVQPSMQAIMKDPLHVPDFGKNFCPPIYPLQDQQSLSESIPLICLHSLQELPSPAPPSFASQTVINCQPLMINLQEESCLRISSFIADGIVVNPGDVLPDTSVNSLVFSLKELDITVPIDPGQTDNSVANGDDALQNCFAGARLHIEDLVFSESPSMKLKLLDLDKDPACFCLWEGQPVDASQKKWRTQASHLSLSLEICGALREYQRSSDWSVGLWRCVELHEICMEAAMVTADGSPIKTIPPPGGIARIGVSCQQFISNASVEQLFFVLDIYAYFGRVSEKIAEVGRTNKHKENKKESLRGKLMEKVPSDTAVSLAVNDLQLRFLEHSSINNEGMPLVQFTGEGLFIKVSHRTLGGAIAVSSNIHWTSVRVDCVDTEGNLALQNGVVDIPTVHLVTGNGHPQMRAVFWIDNRIKRHSDGIIQTLPFLEINVVHVMPYDERDMECHSMSVSAKIAGVRLGGGMNYTEALLHRFGILGPDGGPGEGLLKGLKNLSAGPLPKLMRTSSLIEVELEENGSTDDERSGGFLDLGMPDDIDVSVELKNWLFALEGAQEMAERWWFYDDDVSREEMCWHIMFQSLLVKGKSTPKHVQNGEGKAFKTPKYPVELITVGVQGLQAIKPQTRKDVLQAGAPLQGIKSTIENSGGVNLEVRMVVCEDNDCVDPIWVVENLKFSVKQPIEVIATKDELQQLTVLCKSEFDSVGRIAAGILRVLKLDASIGQAAIDQLSNLGSDGLEKIFSPKTLSRGSSSSRIGFSQSLNMIPESPQSFESTVASLESVISDSQAKCSTLIDEISNPDLSVQTHLSDIKQLSQKLERMQILMTRLRTQI